MKKSKISVGQCYEKDDHVYMVVAGPFKAVCNGKPWWYLKDTLTSGFVCEALFESDLVMWRRAFDNWG
jgi:hypothetical protein